MNEQLTIFPVNETELPQLRVDEVISCFCPKSTQMKRYKIVYADPPWNYNGQIYERGGTENHYETMTTNDIANMNIDDITDWDSVCFMWATFPKLKDALHVMKCWGFDYKTVAFTWVKMNKKADTPFFGMGKWTRSNAEICLLGVKNEISRAKANVSQVIMSPILEHSKKPDETRDLIIQLMGDLPRVELFARQSTIGWDVWGNEVECDVAI